MHINLYPSGQKNYKMPTIKEQKVKLRNQIKQLKSLHTDAEKEKQSAIIFMKVEQLSVFQKANTILLYWSMDDEVSTHNFIEKWWKTKTILLPVVDGNTLRIKKYAGKQSMKPGEQFGILEPIGIEFTSFENIDLIILPGMAFDQKNNRLGRGRGYYDKLLETTKAVRVGVCFDFQYFENIPVEMHDLPMGIVVNA
jgi:5-formyltetrahydrofolate cyclo-ligase